MRVAVSGFAAACPEARGAVYSCSVQAMDEKKIAIGVCTFRRPVQLRRCLQSLTDMERPHGIRLSIIVADNDPDQSARPIVAAFVKMSDIPAVYTVEPRRGIPSVRNRVLRQAMELGVTELAFIDDDEYVDARWLVTLWDHYARSGADVAAGYVETVYPPATPRWIVEGRFFRNAQRPSGERLASAATGNVLFDVHKLVGQWGLWFDERFGLAGGSDADFFSRAAKRGAVIIGAGDARAYEVLASERMNLRYLLVNRFRKSNLKPGYADLSPAQKSVLFRGLLKQIMRGMFMLPFSLLRGFSRFAAELTRTVAAVANLMALLGWRIRLNQYRAYWEKNEKKNHR